MNPPIFSTKFAAYFDLLKMDFCLRTKIYKTNAKITIYFDRKKQKKIAKKTDEIRETGRSFTLSRLN